MLFLYIYCLTFVYVVNSNSTDEKLKKLNILVNNDVWSEFKKGPQPIEHTNGKNRIISFRELFLKSNGAVFTEDNYSEKSKNFHTMLSCNFAIGFKCITIRMNQIWKESKKCSSEENENEEHEIEEHKNEEDCKNNLGNASCNKFETPPESLRVENEAFSATKKRENSSSGEFDVIKYSKDNLIESLDASVPELMRQSLSHFTQLSEIEEKESILPALDMMTQFANDKFSIDSIDDNILKMNNILTEFIKNNCWFNENRRGPMLETVYDIERESWRTCSDPEHYLADQIVKLHQYFKKRIINLGFKNVD